MNYLNEYQTMKAEFFSQPKFRNGQFPTYDKWVKAYIQGDILRSEVSPQGMLDITCNLDCKSNAYYLQKKNQKKKKLSTKERLLKKLLEKKRKELQEIEEEMMLNKL